MKSLGYVISLTLAMLVAPLHAQNLTAVQQADIQKAVKERMLALFRTFDALDMDAAASFVSRDKLIGEVTAGRVETSIEAMTKRWKSNNANIVRRKNDVQEVKVHVFSPDTALSTGRSLLRNEYKNGSVTNHSWLGTYIWVREAGEWKIAFLASSSSVIK